MINKVFIDSGAWLASMNKKDKHHGFASEYFVELRKNQTPLVTSNYIISETITWMNYDNKHDMAIKVMKIWEEIEQLGLLYIYWVDKVITQDAWHIFQKFSDQKLSFTDCTSFAVCRKLNIDRIFGFDKHFNTLGFLLSPYQIHESQAEYNILQPGISQNNRL